jgi:hypothetical protein
MKTTSERIKELTEEIKAMQADPLLKNQYGEKIRELMKLRRKRNQEGKKSNE